MASDLERFFAYAKAFEMAYIADAWPSIAPFFADDARHVVHDAGPLVRDSRGRDAVVEGLRQACLSLDRRFDVRIPGVAEGPVVRADGIWMRFALVYRRAGLPDLTFEGEHLARYEDGRITLLEERLVPGAAARIESYLAEHGDRLRPAGSPFNFDLTEADRRDLDREFNRALVRSYGAAKSRADIGAALATCGPDFRLETVSMGVTGHGREEVAQQLAVFFAAFPDYGVTMDGMAAEGSSVTCWGDARMTFAGPLLGHAPTGRTARLPYVCVFGCADGVIRSERFFFDLATLCEQIGLPMAELTASLAVLRPDAAAAPALVAGVRGGNGAAHAPVGG
jgi:predicted ester cyclase